MILLKTIHFKVPKTILFKNCAFECSKKFSIFQWHRFLLEPLFLRVQDGVRFGLPCEGFAGFMGCVGWLCQRWHGLGSLVLLGKFSRSGFALHWFHLCLSRSVSLCFTLFLLKCHSMTDHSGTDQTPQTFKTDMLIMRRSRRSRPYDPVEGRYKSVTQF